MGLFHRLKKVKILLIDDDEYIRDSLSLFFQNEGCHFIALEDAEEGIEALKREHYDIIISDYKLPGINGLEFLKLVNDSYPDATGVLITAYCTSDVFSEAIGVGVKDFIQKPFTTAIIEKSLLQLIKKGNGRDRELYMNGEKLSSIDDFIRQEPL